MLIWSSPFSNSTAYLIKLINTHLKKGTVSVLLTDKRPKTFLQEALEYGFNYEYKINLIDIRKNFSKTPNEKFVFINNINRFLDIYGPSLLSSLKENIEKNKGKLYGVYTDWGTEVPPFLINLFKERIYLTNKGQKDMIISSKIYFMKAERLLGVQEYKPRILILGYEKTGKTTLIKKLSDVYSQLKLSKNLVLDKGETNDFEFLAFNSNNSEKLINLFGEDSIGALILVDDRQSSKDHAIHLSSLLKNKKYVISNLNIASKDIKKLLN